MNYQALKQYQNHLLQEDYFMCHEILEETWKLEDSNLNKDSAYVCLIQYACALHHLKNNNIVGYQKTLINLKSHLNKEALEDINLYFLNFEQQYEKLQNIESYETLNIYLKQDLIEYIKQNLIINTFALSNIDNIKNLELFYQNDKLHAYILEDNNNNIMLNILQDTDEDIIDNCRNTLLKFKENNDQILDFTCDLVSRDYLLNKQDFSKLFNDTECFLASLSEAVTPTNNYKYVIPKKDDYQKYLAFHNKIFDQNRKSNLVDFPTELLENTIVVYDEDDDFIFSASTTDQNKQVAMIIGVATDPKYRAKGYATEGVAKLCQKMQEKGCIPVLFYINPVAASIYKRLGFKDLDTKYFIIRFNEER